MSSATNPQITFSFLPRFLLILLHRSKFSLGSSPHYCFFVHFSISSLIQHLLGGVVKCLRCTHCMQNKFSAPLFTHHLNEETKRCPYIQNFHSVSAPWTGKLKPGLTITALCFTQSLHMHSSLHDVVPFLCFIFNINESQYMSSSATCFPYSTLHFWNPRMLTHNTLAFSLFTAAQYSAHE